jgi:hypothetical protein
VTDSLSIGRATVGIFVAALLLLPGCGPNDGLSDYDRKVQGEQKVSESLASQGAKVQQKHYPQGSAWAVNLSGLTITDDLLRQVKQLGNVTELDLSKSTITDDQLGLLSELDLNTYLL